MSDELYEAIVDGEIDTVKLLMEQGENIHHVTANDKWTYLHKAADTEDTPPESIQFLIDQGLDVNAIDNYGYTPLIYAVRQRNVQVIRILLENGANEAIEHRGNDSQNALDMAFNSHPFEYNVVKILLEYGANPDSCAPGGKSVREAMDIIAGIDPVIKELIAKY
ncbi:ankyrin repeat domain-containing protein [Photobacterium sp. SP02]|uniref:ankyrin repeat domain-containing protein n=1 Tax=Photobacterium sp. SP02 TaxID=3032280 RepID=UPI0031453F3A